MDKAIIFHTMPITKTPFKKFTTLCIPYVNTHYEILAVIGNFIVTHPKMNFSEIIIHTDGFRGNRLERIAASNKGHFHSIIEAISEHVPQRFSSKIGKTHVTFLNAETNHAVNIVVNH